VNQTIKTFLHHFFSNRQDNWYQLLPVAKLVFNNSVSSSTGYFPFFSQFAFHPCINMLTKGSSVPAAEYFLSVLLTIQESLQDNLWRAKDVQKMYVNQRTWEGPVYQPNDWV
jgi:hypothetical protein